MSQESQETTKECKGRKGWVLLGAFALLGIATAAILVLNRKRQGGHLWNVDDLIDAADRAADNLERALIGDQVRVS